MSLNSGSSPMDQKVAVVLTYRELEYLNLLLERNRKSRIRSRARYHEKKPASKETTRSTELLTKIVVEEHCSWICRGDGTVDPRPRVEVPKPLILMPSITLSKLPEHIRKEE